MKFPHRPNCDGTIDSICPHCFATVATSSSEQDLDRIEAVHHCDPARLAYFDSLLACDPPLWRERDTGLIGAI